MKPIEAWEDFSFNRSLATLLKYECSEMAHILDLCCFQAWFIFRTDRGTKEMTLWLIIYKYVTSI